MTYNERIEELKTGSLQERLQKIQEFSKTVTEDIAEATMTTTAAVYGWKSRSKTTTPLRRKAISKYFGEPENVLFNS
jgi:hypothetical protein